MCYVILTKTLVYLSKKIQNKFIRLKKINLFEFVLNSKKKKRLKNYRKIIKDNY